MRKTAKAYRWKVTGKMEHCQECQESNLRKKSVDKETETKSTKPGERVFLDGTSYKFRSLGGAKFLVGLVDDCMDYTWVQVLKCKCDQVKTVMRFLHLMKARGTPVKFI